MNQDMIALAVIEVVRFLMLLTLGIFALLGYRKANGFEKPSTKRPRRRSRRGLPVSKPIRKKKRNGK